jgi:hypothetical protein
LGGEGLRVIGIDLAGDASKPTGFTVLSRKTLCTKLVYSDDEIISSCLSKHPKLIAVDAPLSRPLKGNLRSSDLALIKRGLRVLPPTLGGMRQLTERGIRIAKKLRGKGLRVIEIHPRTSGVLIFGTDDRQRWIRGLSRQGFRMWGRKTKHEIDAALAAVTAWLHLQKKTETVGEGGEGTIVIPLPRPL